MSIIYWLRNNFKLNSVSIDTIFIKNACNDISFSTNNDNNGKGATLKLVMIPWKRWNSKCYYIWDIHSIHRTIITRTNMGNNHERIQRTKPHFSRDFWHTKICICFFNSAGLETKCTIFRWWLITTKMIILLAFCSNH